MISISNFISKENSPWPLAEAVRSARSLWPKAPARAADVTAQAGSARFGRTLASLGRVLLSWLAAIRRRCGDRLFARNDTEAYWRGWQVTMTGGGLARRYRDPRFDTLAECPKCLGAGVIADLPCTSCLGTGRITLGEVS